LRRGRNGRMFLIAVGDRVAKIAWFSQPRSDGSRILQHQRGAAHAAGRAGAGLAGGYFALPPPGCSRCSPTVVRLNPLPTSHAATCALGAASTLRRGGPAHPIPPRGALVPPDPSSILRIRGARHTRLRAAPPDTSARRCGASRCRSSSSSSRARVRGIAITVATSVRLCAGGKFWQRRSCAALMARQLCDRNSWGRELAGHSSVPVVAA
jgi:hypothetical protein